MKVAIELSPDDAAYYHTFVKLPVRHRRQAQAFDEAWSSLGQARQSRVAHPGGEALITLLCGPTGVGKTRLWEHVLAYAAALHRKRSLPGRLPHLYLKADVPSTGMWQMKPFYTAALIAADEILIGQKQVVRGASAVPSSGQATTAGLRQATLNMLKYREPIVFGIDEAHHLVSHSSDKQRDANLDAIKTFADESAAPILLIGSYEAIVFRAASGRLGRRVHPIHLARYNIDEAADLKDFRDVVHTFAQHLQFDGYDLTQAHVYLHERTAGCVGNLKQWLAHALYTALVDGRRKIRKVDIESTEPAPDLLAQWLVEINSGEAAVNATMKATPRKPSPPPAPSSKPFQRNKIADPVGGGRGAATTAA